MHQENDAPKGYDHPSLMGEGPYRFYYWLYSLSKEEVDAAISEHRAEISQLTRRLILVWLRNRSLAGLFLVLVVFFGSSGIIFCAITRIDNTSFTYWVISGATFGLVVWVVATHPGINSFGKRLADQEGLLTRKRSFRQEILRMLQRHKRKHML